MSFALRDYQIAACDSVEKKWEGHQSTMIVLPTGCGKTLCFSEIIYRRQPGRALIICHREELIHQARHKIETTTGLDCEIEMADLMASTSLFHQQPVIIATVQTLVSGGKKKRMERFKPNDFSTIVIDEFHHATAASYRKVLDYFLQNKETKLLGVTATPDRADEEALGQVCESVAYDYEILDAIHDGWLVPVEQQLVTVADLDYSAVRTSQGDLNGADLAAILEAEKVLHGMASSTLKIVGDRQAIFFAASVKHAEMVCNIFNRHRDGIAEWVCGTTDKEERRKTMKAILSGKTQILCNVGVATEGFDAPGVEVIVMGRPTKSRALYAQMAGRATRPLPGVVDGPLTAVDRKQAISESRKKACLLIDFVGNSGRHKLMTGADILGGKYSEEAKELAHEIMEREGGSWRIAKALEKAEEELIAARKAEAERKRKMEEARKAKLLANAKFTSRNVNPFDAWDIQPVSNDRNPNGKTLTEKQRGLLLKHVGVDPDSLSYANAQKLLNELFRRWNENLCSVKQANLLKKHGFDGAKMKREEAKRIIDKIAANNWRVPAGLSVTTSVTQEEFL